MDVMKWMGVVAGKAAEQTTRAEHHYTSPSAWLALLLFSPLLHKSIYNGERKGELSTRAVPERGFSNERLAFYSGSGIFCVRWCGGGRMGEHARRRMKWNECCVTASASKQRQMGKDRYRNSVQ